MTRVAKYGTAFFLILLTSMTLMLALNGVYAQDEEPFPNFPVPIPGFPPPEANAGVVVVSSLGGITDPTPGTYYYPNGTVITLKATPYIGFKFQYWVMSGQYTPGHNVPPTILTTTPTEEEPQPPPTVVVSDIDSLVSAANPFIIQCGYGYTYQYQAVFAPSAPTVSTSAVLIVLSAAGGTTNPSPGTYTYGNDSLVTLQATPDSGFEFKYWVISGSIMPGHGEASMDNDIVTDNPLSTHTPYGYTYNYQPVFTPVTSTVPGGIPVEYLYAAVAVIAIIAVIAIALAMMYMKRSKTPK